MVSCPSATDMLYSTSAQKRCTTSSMLTAQILHEGSELVGTRDARLRDCWGYKSRVSGENWRCYIALYLATADMVVVQSFFFDKTSKCGGCEMGEIEYSSEGTLTRLVLRQ